MPKYQSPGVYVEEYASGKSIQGVSTSTDRFTLRSLAAELREIVLRFDPNWTDHNSSDPGVTLVEVVAWVAQTALHDATALPEQGRRAAMRAAAALATFAEPCGQADAPLTRPRFSPGQLLTAEDLQLEQDYHREKLRRHNLGLLGFGIVEGLEVSVGTTADAPDGRIHVLPGMALDACGNELCVEGGAVLGLPQSGERVFVSVRHWDKPCSPVLSPGGETTPSRIEEVCVVAVVDTIVKPALALARLIRSEGRWVVDPAFVPRRVSQYSTKSSQRE